MSKAVTTLMTDSLFSRPWFSHIGLAGITQTLHGTEERVQDLERRFFNQIALFLLDRQRAGDAEVDAIFSFFAFCQRNLRRTQSQILQDLWVLYMSGEKRGGYFVEFGACDGRLLSNTWLLERDYGWTGLLAEPNPAFHGVLSANRACTISRHCVSATGGRRVAFRAVDAAPELSHIAEVDPGDVHERSGARRQSTLIEVETITLNELLESVGAPQVIDYLSVDTEGSEYRILEVFDFDRYAFRFITVEHAGEETKREAIRTLLESHGYRRWRPELTRWDDWYLGPEA